MEVPTLVKEVIGIGKTVVLAKEDACRTLNVDFEELDFEILQMPTKKTFGIFGGKEAKVRATIKTTPAKMAVQYINDIIKCMALSNIDVTVEEDKTEAKIDLKGDDVGYLIGRRGETLDALQYLSGLVANHSGDSYYKICVDTSNYREKREKTLQDLGVKMARKALKTGNVISLEPMNPYERRIIHTSIQKIKGISSWSEGNDQSRHVIIAPMIKRKSYYKKGKLAQNTFSSDRINDEKFENCESDTFLNVKTQVKDCDTPLYSKVSYGE